MQALRYHSHGDPADVLQLDEVEQRPLEEGEVRLRNLASPLNPADLNIIQGNYGKHPGLPATGGLEGCGEVLESRFSDLAEGDRVIALRPVGSWAERAVGQGKDLFKVPQDLDLHQFAMLKVNPATAWRLLTAMKDLPPGAWVVQNAANSAVGRCVIAFAKHLGFRTINLVRRPQCIAELEALGGDRVLLDNDEAIAVVKDAKPALALNSVGGESALRQLKMLEHGGLHVTYGAMAKRPVTVPASALIFQDLQVRGFWMTRWVETAPAEEVTELYARLVELLRKGVFSIPVDSTFPLEEYREALARLEAPDRKGKVLFVPQSE